MSQIISTADLANVISDPAMVSDVQSILDCAVVSLGKLKGFFVAQLKKRRRKRVIYIHQTHRM